MMEGKRLKEEKEGRVSGPFGRQSFGERGWTSRAFRCL